MPPGVSRILVTIFLCGDVMTGRGIDQVLPHPSAPRIYEPYVRDARVYVGLGERAHGPIPKPVDFPYIWGDALGVLERMDPDLRMINLETAVTTSEDYWRGKGINYRMHPSNIACITAAGIDFASFANNHVLDWGYSGLKETIQTLETAGVRSAGAGENIHTAESPAVFEIDGKGRVVVFSFGSVTSGIPLEWAATEERPGVNVLKDLSGGTVARIAQAVQEVKRQGDIVVVSIHWGGNWGYGVPHRQRQFAHRLVEEAGVDLVHGHSSHHPRGIEVYQERAIIYGCGDLINDYEGIRGYEEFRADLSLMYFVSMDPATGKLAELRMTPTRMKNFRVSLASDEEARWLGTTLTREGLKLGTRVAFGEDNTLQLVWK
jgi:poly-gamma-glutamate synthesis protein (capsule biosynthesis protein)